MSVCVYVSVCVCVDVSVCVCECVPMVSTFTLPLSSVLPAAPAAGLSGPSRRLDEFISSSPCLIKR